MIVVVVGSGLDSFHSTEFGLVVVCGNFRGFAYFRRGGGECLVWFLLASCLLFAAPDPLNPVLGRWEIAFDGVDGGADGGAAKQKRIQGHALYSIHALWFIRVWFKRVFSAQYWIS